MTPGQRAVHLVLALALCGLALGLYHARRDFIRGFFLDGPGGPAPALAMPASGSGSDSDSGSDSAALMTPVERVRVVLLDGVNASVTHELPAYDRLCDSGVDLTVDVGFPTVSLPVQQVLWTGWTQTQSGVLFHGKPQVLDMLEAGSSRERLAHGIPAQVPDSLAIAESHQYIIHALGFAEVLPASPTEMAEGWSDPDYHTDGDFLAHALEAVASDRRLVFVHVLRVDVAGHRKGGLGSPAFDEAARAADRMLERLVAAEKAAHPAGTRWLILADHGHRARAHVGPGGGHGGAERYIRQVRGCFFGEVGGEVGPGEAPAAGSVVHLVDVSRALRDSLGLAPEPRSAGRALGDALRAPVQHDATLPSPSPGRWAGAIAVLFLGLLITAWGASGRLACLPWWWPVAMSAVFILVAGPTLSAPMVYRPRGELVYTAGLPGIAVLALTLGWMRVLGPRGAGQGTGLSASMRALAGQLALPLAGAIAAGVLSAGSDVLAIALGSASEPPLMPRYTALTSVLLILAYVGCAVGALAMTVAALAPDRPLARPTADDPPRSRLGSPGHRGRV